MTRKAFSYSIITALVASAGCATPSRHVANIPPVSPRVVTDSPADQALATLARLKANGEHNMVFALSYVEAGPAELPSVPIMLESLMANVVGTGVRYLPWDYFNPNKAPILFPKNVGIANPARPQIAVPEGGDPQIAIANSDFGQLLIGDRNKDGTLPEYLRLRVDLTVDKDVKTVNRGLVLRALAKFGSEYAEGNLDIDREETGSRVTCILTLLTQKGDLHGTSVVVTADIVRIGAGNKVGVIIAGNGLNYFEKATAAPGMAAAMRETLGHAVFVLVCKLLEVDHERALTWLASGSTGTTISSPVDANRYLYRHVPSSQDTAGQFPFDNSQGLRLHQRSVAPAHYQPEEPLLSTPQPKVQYKRLYESIFRPSRKQSAGQDNERRKHTASDRTPLQQAIINRDPAMVHYLLAKGADINVPLGHAFPNALTLTRFDLACATQNGWKEDVEALRLIEAILARHVRLAAGSSSASTWRYESPVPRHGPSAGDSFHP